MAYFAAVAAFSINLATSPETGTWDNAIKRATGLGVSAAKSFGNASGLTARKPSPTGPMLLAAAGIFLPDQTNSRRRLVAWPLHKQDP